MGWAQTLPTTTHSQTLTAGQEVTGIDFGNRSRLGSIAGLLWNDQNANGIFAAENEAGIASVTITLYLDDGDETFEPGEDGSTYQHKHGQRRPLRIYGPPPRNVLDSGRRKFRAVGREDSRHATQSLAADCRLGPVHPLRQFQLLHPADPLDLQHRSGGGQHQNARDSHLSGHAVLRPWRTGNGPLHNRRRQCSAPYRFRA